MHVLSTNPQSFQTIIIIHLIQVCPCFFGVQNYSVPSIFMQIFPLIFGS